MARTPAGTAHAVKQAATTPTTHCPDFLFDDAFLTLPFDFHASTTRATSHSATATVESAERMSISKSRWPWPSIISLRLCSATRGKYRKVKIDTQKVPSHINHVPEYPERG